MALKILECLLYLLVPSFMGWLWELSAGVSGILAMAVSLALIAVWYWAGRRFAKHIANPVIALAVGNSTGLLSLGTYLWQEYLTAEKFTALQHVSQWYSAALTSVTVPLAARFSPVVDGVTQVSNTVLQAVGFALLAALFAVSYFTQRKLASAAQ